MNTENILRYFREVQDDKRGIVLARHGGRILVASSFLIVAVAPDNPVLELPGFPGLPAEGRAVNVPGGYQFGEPRGMLNLWRQHESTTAPYLKLTRWVWDAYLDEGLAARVLLDSDGRCVFLNRKFTALVSDWSDLEQHEWRQAGLGQPVAVFDGPGWMVALLMPLNERRLTGGEVPPRVPEGQLRQSELPEAQP